MKALLFSALGRGSGCALRARHLAEGLRRNGLQTVVLEPPFPNLPFALETLLSLPWFAWKAWISAPDLALGVKPYPNVWLALWICRLKGARAVCDVDDWDWAWRGGLAAALSRLAQAPAWRLLQSFSTHHPDIRTKLMAKRREVHWLRQGVDPALFPRAPKAPQGPLLFVAHLNVACQLPLLMEWIGPLLEEPGCPPLVVAGGGPLLSRWRAAYRHAKVHFTGPLTPRQAAEWMSRARLCLAAYGPFQGNQARVPMKVYEYLAAGRPVVANLIPGLEELRPYLYAAPAHGPGFRRCVRSLLWRGGDGREARGRRFVLRRRCWKEVTREFLNSLAGTPP